MIDKRTVDPPEEFDRRARLWRSASLFAQGLLALVIAISSNYAADGRFGLAAWTVAIAATGLAVVLGAAVGEPNGSLDDSGRGATYRWATYLLVPAIGLCGGFLFRTTLLGTSFVREREELLAWFAGVIAAIATFGAVIVGFRLAMLGQDGDGEVRVGVRLFRLLRLCAAVAVTLAAWVCLGLLFDSDDALVRSTAMSKGSVDGANERVAESCGETLASIEQQLSQANRQLVGEVEGLSGPDLIGNRPVTELLAKQVAELRQDLLTQKERCDTAREARDASVASADVEFRRLMEERGTSLPVRPVSGTLLLAMVVGSELAFSVGSSGTAKAEVLDLYEAIDGDGEIASEVQ